ncbi:hypothetical protein BDF14DRAFT_1757870 [Spinellus fusiger]|nr:hypothetical protein BDF14DRAFT_1757870 [Spinellus fusiger]
MNSTLLPEGYELNWCETQWMNMYQDRNPLIVTGIFAFLMHEVVYFGRFLPFFICDFIPSFQRYKIQEKKENTREEYWKCVKHVLFQHFAFEGPMIFGFYPMASYFGMDISAPFPLWSTMAVQIAIFFFVEDFYHYVMHRFMHWPPFYKRVHKVHHEYVAPLGMAAEYAHPVETAILGLGTVGSPLLYHSIVVALHMDPKWNMHLVTMLLWIVCRLMQAVDAHSGYDFPWSLRHWVPFWAGADHHDYHHQAFVGNYASSFRWWDYLLGTDVKYRAFRQQQKEARLKQEQAKEKSL